MIFTCYIFIWDFPYWPSIEMYDSILVYVELSNLQCPVGGPQSLIFVCYLKHLSSQ